MSDLVSKVDIALLILSSGVFAYLIYALLFPEEF